TPPCFDVAMDLAVLTDAVDQLSASDPSVHADADSIESLYRLRARLDALVTQRTAAFDAAGNWEPDGAYNATAWLTTRCRLPRPEARRIVRRGRDLRHLPHTDRAWTEGAITGAQVDVVGQLRSLSTEDVLRRDEEMLVEQAAELRYDAFVKAAAYWKHRADPEGVNDDDEKRRARRDVYLERSFDDMWLGKITLDPVNGSIVGEELRRLEQEMFEADWAAAREALGRDPAGSDLPRTPGQRRADALVEMATRSRTAPSDGHRPRPLFTVLIDFDSLCELADGTVLAPGALLPWFDTATFERVIFAPDGRIQVSSRARLFTGATRRAIEIRDRECMHPYCDIPAGSCQIDHIVPVAKGGLTVQENGQVLCKFHNRQKGDKPFPGD
ncbi:MAG TPA: DUF222 domain-containing protein, partial [Acidimicrobiales bacterium]